MVVKKLTNVSGIESCSKRAPIFIGLVCLILFGWALFKVVPYFFNRTITVTGTATKQQQNEVAKYNATVTSKNSDKTEAVSDAKAKAEKLVSDVKNFGIPDKDILTQSTNIYREQESYYDSGVQKFRDGDWNANITVEITVRDTAKVNALTDLLASNDISSLYGPSFSLEEGSVERGALLKAAFDDAKGKADSLAGGIGMKVGKVKSVVEGVSYDVYPLARASGMGAGGGGGMEPGSSTVSETLTVTFELR